MLKFKNLQLSKITLYALLLVTVVVLCLFYCGGYIDPDAEYAEPVYTNALIVLMYVLLGIGILVALVSMVISITIKLKMDARQSLRGMIVTGFVAAVLIITYLAVAGDPVAVLGDSIPLSKTWLKLVDMQLYTMYILLGVAILVTILGTFSKKVK